MKRKWLHPILLRAQDGREWRRGSSLFLHTWGKVKSGGGEQKPCWLLGKERRAWKRGVFFIICPLSRHKHFNLLSILCGYPNRNKLDVRPLISRSVHPQGWGRVFHGGTLQLCHESVMSSLLLRDRTLPKKPCHVSMLFQTSSHRGMDKPLFFM